MGEALPLGGVTAMAARWMRNDPSARTHSLALLSQGIPVPDELVQAVSATGGTIYTVSPSRSFVERAAWLRNLATETADLVILHVDVTDVVPGAAFGINGGPPVLLVNHTAHLFWVGASVVDVLLNCRGSALEGEWAAIHRGIPRYGTVPIPLLERLPSSETSGTVADKKLAARKNIGIPDNAVVILSVGASFKYLAANGLDFVEVCETILREVPDAYVLIVGTRADDRWHNASQRTGGRIRVLGTMPQSQLASVREATDIYIEGFPFGTTTSLLEAGLEGIPVVLAPIQCPPPYGTDGVALDDILERPGSIAEYKNSIVHLCQNPAARTLIGNQIRNCVAQHHTGAGWKQHLADIMHALPSEHGVHAITTMAPTPGPIHEYWARFKKKWVGEEAILEHALLRAFTLGLRPRLTPAVQQVCRNYQDVRRRQVIPLPVLAVLCNSILPLCSAAGAARVLGWFVSFFHGGLWSRLGKKLGRIFNKREARQLPYAEYRQIGGAGSGEKATLARQVQTP
jgi:glycosyltransferase involved in cell wall biosynthesis